MRIPLDYYRIIGLPLQASADQIEQAYQDRVRQKPHSEYTQQTLDARKQWLDRAYQVLSDPEQRNDYDAHYLLITEKVEGQQVALPEIKTEQEPLAITSQTPTIKINTLAQFQGALLLLYELGEYQRVRQLAEWVLAHPQVFYQPQQTASSQQQSVSHLQFRDVVLTLALSCWELGRELWRKEQYEAAGEALNRGHQVLVDWDLFPQIRQDMANELEKLSPYRILELLSNRNVDEKSVSKAIKLLERMFQRRGGIDGQLDDGSGLNVDEFLHFLQQIREKLTAAEQEELFAKQAQRSSGVAKYLAACAAIARGFAYLNPNYILKAQQWLTQLQKGRKQGGSQTDVYLEQAICALLLGQTETAINKLQYSQEQDAIAEIQAYGRQQEDEPDWLLGLCRYVEQWLQSVLFPKFLDLTYYSSSLKDYFASESVQQTLETLETEPTQPQDPSTEAIQTTPSTEQSLPPARAPQQQRSRSVPQKQSPSSWKPHRQSHRKKRTVVRWRMTALVGTSGVLLGALLLLGLYRAGNALWSNWFPSNIEGEPLSLPVNQPLVNIPNPNQNQVQQSQELNEEKAKDIIKRWLAAKGQALGPDYNTEPLQKILVPSLVSQWRQSAKTFQRNNTYQKYQHEITIKQVKSQGEPANKGTIIANVHEISKFYRNGTLSEQESYDSHLKVRYDVVRQDQNWFIQEIEPLNL